MDRGNLERRRGRRISLEAPLQIRRGGPGASPQLIQETTKNISLAGAYFETEQPKAYTINDVVVSSVSIPTAQTRGFPFTRIAGRSRVVRVEELPGGGQEGAKRYGVALEFADDVTALTALPSRG